MIFQYKFLLLIIVVVILIFICFININIFENFNYGLMGSCSTHSIFKNDKCIQNNNSINKYDIIKMYNNLSYSNENDGELPNGGLLISMFDNNYVCDGKKDYKTIIENVDINKNEKCISVEECEGFDFKDIKKILNKNTHINGTSCYALDTSYMRADFPSVLFGPLIGDTDIPLTDISFGIILDINKLKKYSSCLFINDSGSVGRYNRIYNNNNNNNNKKFNYIPGKSIGRIETSTINDNEIKNNYTNLLNSKKGRELAQAGCGLQTNYQGIGLSGIFNEKKLPTGEFNNFIGANNVILDKYSKNNDPFKNDKILNGEFTINMLSLRRNRWKIFINNIKRKVELIKQKGNLSKIWKNNILNFNSGKYEDLFYENEVDIFIPNKKLKDGGKNCEPTEEFKNVWKNSVIGIFTNNRCIKDINYNKLCNNCGKLQSYDCSVENICCCNKKFNEDLVKKLVLKFNTNSNNIINGYVMNDNLNPSEDYPEPNLNTGLYDLQIKQITNYKSYNNIPISIQKEKYYNQYFYEIKCNDICGIDNSKNRTVGIAVPHNSNGKYIMHFSFTRGNNIIGYSCNDGTSVETIGGVISFKYLDKYCKEHNGINPNLNYYQNYLHQMIKKGYIIISLTECSYDISSYLPGKDKSNNSKNCSMYWQNEDNSDARYLKELFKEIYCNNFIDDNQNELNIIYNEICLLGYSVGSQMVSRCFNEFPLMYTSKNNTGQSFKFPNIKCGILIAGGSYYCYSDYVSNNKEQINQCIDPKVKGCCPVGITEINYDKELIINNHKFLWNEHPYTFLIQSENDIWADPQAALKYYNSTPKNYIGEFLKLNDDKEINFKNDKLVYVQYSKGNIHGLSNINQVNNMIKFTLKYL